MQYFIEHGKVSFTGKTERIKSDNGKSKIVNTSVAKYASEIKAEVYKFIKDALKNKSKNRYGTGCLLIIAFEDHIGFRGDKDKNELLEFADKELDCSSLEFEAIYLVGMSGKNIIPVKKLVV